MLDEPRPLIGLHLVGTFRIQFLDALLPVAEQVIDAPEDTWNVEQLLDVLTEVLLPGQKPLLLPSRSLIFQFVAEVYKGFHPGQSSTALAEQIVDFPVLGGSPHPGSGSAASAAVSRDEDFHWFFRTFSRLEKSAESAASPSPRVPESSIRAHGRRRLMKLHVPDTADGSPLDHSAFLAEQRKEEEEQTAKWMAWMEENKRRRRKEVKLRKQKKVLETSVQAVEAHPRDPAATSSSIPSASSSGASGYSGDAAHRGAGWFVPVPQIMGRVC